MNRLLILTKASVQRMLVVLMAVFALAGCQTTPVSFSGGIVPSSRQVQLVENGERLGRYSTEDVHIDYEYSRAGNALTISGTIYFADRIKYNFFRVETFHADLILVDAEGRVLETQGLTSSSHSMSDSGESFSRKLLVPANAVAISFSYSGTAKSDDHDGRWGGLGGDMYFSDYPAR